MGSYSCGFVLPLQNLLLLTLIFYPNRLTHRPIYGIITLSYKEYFPSGNVRPPHPPPAAKLGATFPNWGRQIKNKPYNGRGYLNCVLVYTIP